MKEIRAFEAKNAAETDLTDQGNWQTPAATTQAAEV